MQQPPRTLYLDDANDAVVILDQTRLPAEVAYVPLTTAEEAWRAIKDLLVRGAPAIGVTAALGLYIHMKRFVQEKSPDTDAFLIEAKRVGAYLNTSRPTAVNLQWATKVMCDAIAPYANKTEEETYNTKQSPAYAQPATLLQILRDTAMQIYNDDINNNRSIGQHGATLLKPGMGILTHCNAGALATAGYGTALAPIYCAHEQGMSLRVYADETRPVLQGARLTAFELQTAGVDVTLLCDNMAATVMANGWVDIIFVGADRVAANGDTANKIGTLGVAIMAKHYGIPFYVCAPFSTIDPATPTGREIIIEQRDPAEVTDLWYAQPMAPAGVKVYNPSFDVTPAELITGYITENGVLLPPF
ncbi:MAG: S-methyl-5-thioribose-1-phosphate isomerase [Defluviitaleaceae bacterium]|nr:S-methyl-5-thioribose-1-phosphate isomerase [Defluviitaleaceae bacterium]